MKTVSWLLATLAGLVVAGPAMGESIEQTYARMCSRDAQRSTEACVALHKALLEKHGADAQARGSAVQDVGAGAAGGSALAGVHSDSPGLSPAEAEARLRVRISELQQIDPDGAGIEPERAKIIRRLRAYGPVQRVKYLGTKGNLYAFDVYYPEAVLARQILAIGPDGTAKVSLQASLDPQIWGVVSELAGSSFVARSRRGERLYIWDLGDGVVTLRQFDLGDPHEFPLDTIRLHADGRTLLHKNASGLDQKGTVHPDGSVTWSGLVGGFKSFSSNGAGEITIDWLTGMPAETLTRVEPAERNRLLAEMKVRQAAQREADRIARMESNARWSAAVQGTMSALQAGAAVMDELDSHGDQLQHSYEQGLALGTAEYLQRQSTGRGTGQSPSTAGYESAPTRAALQVEAAAPSVGAGSTGSGHRPATADGGQAQVREYFTWCQAHNGDGASPAARAGGPKSYLSYVFATRQPAGPLGIQFANTIAPGFKGGCHPGFGTREEAEASREERAKRFPKSPPVSVQFDAG